MSSRPQDLAVAAICDGLPVAVWVGRVPGGEADYVNQAFADLIGEPPGGRLTLHRRGGAACPDEELPFALAVRAGRTVVVDGVVVHRPDGRWTDVRAIARPIRGADGQIRQVVIVLVDDRARAEAEERLRLVVGSAPVILFALDAQGTVTVSEGRGLEALGLRPGQLVGQSTFELYAGQPEILEAGRRALAGETVRNSVDVGGAHLDTVMGPMVGPDGAVVGVVGVSTDVTERHRMQEQLLIADRMVSMGMLAASVAHEINTPLTYVAGNLDLLARELDGLRASLPTGVGPRWQQFLGDAIQGTLRVTNIVRDLRTFTRAEPDRSRPVDLRPVLESVLRMAESETRYRARVVVAYGDVPPVEADEGRLAQVFLNLIVNAAQAIPEGHPETHEIRVRTSEHEGQVQVEIVDTGEGIDAATLRRVFEPFFSTKRPGEGTGLGLSVSRNIVERFGGRILVESIPGHGATFIVRLPRSQRPGIGEPPSPAVPDVGTRRARILVVDDEPQLRSLFARILGERYRVVSVESGKEALEALAREEFDLILCDVMMRDVSGMDVYAGLRALRPGAESRIVFMTGGTFTEAARRFIASVPNGCLEKPFDVLEEVGRALQRR